MVGAAQAQRMLGFAVPRSGSFIRTILPRLFEMISAQTSEDRASRSRSPRAAHGTAQPSEARYHFSLSVHLLLLAIFGGMGLGFGALVWQTVDEWRRSPASPQPMTVAAATALSAPGDVAWVTLVDARFACEYALRQPSSSYAYGVVRGAGGQRVVVALASSEAPDCQAPAPKPVSGRLERRDVGNALPAGVYWDDLPNEHPGGAAWVLWTDWEPPRGITSGLQLIFFALLSLFGAAIFVTSLWNLAREYLAVRIQARPRLKCAQFRMPLSTGGSALGQFGISFGMFQVVVFGGLFFLTVIPNWLGMVIGVLAAFWVLATFGAFVEGWKRRASDLILASEGCEVRGGPLHGWQHRWDDQARSEALSSALPLVELRQRPGTNHAAAGKPSAEQDSCALYLGGQLAALSQEAAEDRSLQSIAETLHGVSSTDAAQTGDKAHATGATARVSVVHCPSCGAPLPPRESGGCPYCGHDIVLPDAVRKQLAAQASHERDRSDSERLLRRVLRQPSAARVNAAIALLLPPLLLSWPVAGAVFDEYYQGRHIFRPYHGVALAVAALFGNLALQFLLRSQVAARAAVRIIATHFAARPPKQPGAASDCRVCAGPLPERSDQLLILCGYCGAENVTGLNLIPVAAAHAQQAGTLRAALAERLRIRRHYRLLSLASLILLLLAAAALAPVRHALRHRSPTPGAVQNRLSRVDSAILERGSERCFGGCPRRGGPSPQARFRDTPPSLARSARLPRSARDL